MAGYTQSFGQGNLDAYILKLDALGTIQWTRTVGGNDREIAYSIVQTSDGGYALCGEVRSWGPGSADGLVAKLDASGNLQWAKSIGGSAADFFYSIIQSTDGGYAITGYTTSFGAGGSDVYIVKLNSAGAILWGKTAGGTSGEDSWSLVQTSSGGYVIAASTSSFGQGAADFYMVNIDDSGNGCCISGNGGTASDGGTAGSGGSEGNAGGSAGSGGTVTNFTPVMTIQCQ